MGSNLSISDPKFSSGIPNFGGCEVRIIKLKPEYAAHKLGWIRQERELRAKLLGGKWRYGTECN